MQTDYNRLPHDHRVHQKVIMADKGATNSLLGVAHPHMGPQFCRRAFRCYPSSSLFFSFPRYRQTQSRLATRNSVVTPHTSRGGTTTPVEMQKGTTTCPGATQRLYWPPESGHGPSCGTYVLANQILSEGPRITRISRIRTSEQLLKEGEARTYTGHKAQT
ncbi:hypothetical protein KQX54_010087 [Cotesia glomerata]|uniref:Uncharacterized protein n=1 Tax=Cotesia glomerata TaxID=32391 RepID=A0AAV7IRJ9_COTGL|nr:hypothetical protein KQX54_010087 [Cotesia glomerata]